MDLIADLVAVVERCAPSGGAWLREHLTTRPSEFAVAFAAAGRSIGKTPIDDADARRISIPWAAGSGVDECGRGALLLAVLPGVPADDQVELVRGVLRRGENRERQAALRVLAGLPDPERFVELAIDAFRTNVQSVFEALACDNAFPARWFPDAAFNQLVLKCLFVGAPLARLVGLRDRVTGELVRMVDAYASERRAAGRSVPADVELVRSHP